MRLMARRRVLCLLPHVYLAALLVWCARKKSDTIGMEIMDTFKSLLVSFAMLSVACGINVDAKNSGTTNSTISRDGGATSDAGCVDGGATSDAGCVNQAQYTGGLTLIIPSNPPIIEHDCFGYEASFIMPPDSGLGDCSILSPSNAGLPALNDSMTIYVVYQTNMQSNPPGDEYLVGQSQPDCLQGDGWYLTSNGNITLCPKTCVTVQQNPNAVINVIVSSVPQSSACFGVS